MNVKVLFNNAFDGDNPDQGWGLSLLVDQHVLFDVGENEESLRNAIEKKALCFSDITDVAISHDHWDHVGGLKDFLSKKKTLRVHICLGFSADFKKTLSRYPGEVVTVRPFQTITPGVMTTGQMTGFYKDNVIAEQALVLKTEKGVSVVTGCAHPGIIKMLKAIQSHFNVSKFYAVIGGFHLRNQPVPVIEKIVNDFISLKVEYVAPLHCTGSQAVTLFQERYNEKCHILKTLESIEI